MSVQNGKCEAYRGIFLDSVPPSRPVAGRIGEQVVAPRRVAGELEEATGDR